MRFQSPSAVASSTSSKAKRSAYPASLLVGEASRGSDGHPGRVSIQVTGSPPWPDLVGTPITKRFPRRDRRRPSSPEIRVCPSRCRWSRFLSILTRTPVINSKQNPLDIAEISRRTDRRFLSIVRPDSATVPAKSGRKSADDHLPVAEDPILRPHRDPIDFNPAHDGDLDHLPARTIQYSRIPTIQIILAFRLIVPHERFRAPSER